MQIPNIILHITEEKAWKVAKHIVEHRADALASQGFIHCSTPEQYIAVANFVYNGRNDLVLLPIDRLLVRSEIHYEKSGDKYFPHIYGPPKASAVVKEQRLLPRDDGMFDPLPKESV